MAGQREGTRILSQSTRVNNRCEPSQFTRTAKHGQHVLTHPILKGKKAKSINSGHQQIQEKHRTLTDIQKELCLLKKLFIVNNLLY